MIKHPAVSLRGVLGSDADLLFPMIHGSAVTETIQWDGPINLQEYRNGLSEREAQFKSGTIQFFTILESGRPIGAIDLRPRNEFRADIGLWIGHPFHGKGYGTKAVELITGYGFEKLNLRKIEAMVFVGNVASRKIFENNGYVLEGTIRSAVKKRGQFVDEWILGIVRE